MRLLNTFALEEPRVAAEGAQSLAVCVVVGGRFTVSPRVDRWARYTDPARNICDRETERVANYLDDGRGISQPIDPRERNGACDHELGLKMANQKQAFVEIQH